VAHEFGAIATLDGHRCPGVVGMMGAVQVAARLARLHGVGWCAVRNTSHCGAIGYFTSKLAAQGLVGIGMSASKPLMAYHGAKGEALSTNPLSIAIPTSDGSSLVLDMSTAAVALGKIMAAKDAGREIPEGWGVDAEGRTTTDPAKVAAVLPMAGPKGSGLSLMIEMLVSVLPGAPIIAPALLGHKPGGLNGTVVALAPEAFGSKEEFAAAVMELASAIHALEPVEAGGDVLLPGERGAMQQLSRQENGIPVNPGTVGRLRILAEKLDCTVPQALIG
jgi:ureidoglycolate dehydrogenase (NAD+)